MVDIITSLFMQKSNESKSFEATPIVETRRQWSRAIIDNNEDKKTYTVYSELSDIGPTSDDIKHNDSY